MADMSRALGARIREQRKAKGFDSIEAFAHALGFSWPTVSRYERGVTTPDLVRLHKIADVLDTTAEALLAEGEKVA
jgi:transcriptional regulator with XRE-family HTH domain